VGGSAAHASNEHAHSTYTALANWASASLIRARAARIDAGYLVDA
jgi:hypothetical protein